ncbi:IclR family transcriptional regulator [Halocatena salina]|uniref:IclR family transcriptional regulator n=1 Tax=Halocatena salina TaxID=2934340 RepID=A0A8U0A5W7_9EURY|nr:IclR family transcriptional regulator [Halocatena salina]UPM44571.1 IclR family transcriptional regulator [Halocatena salina]
MKNGYTYSLSLRFLDIAEYVKNEVAKHDIVEDEVNSLAVDTGELVHFGAEEAGQVVYISKARGDAAVETVSSIGKRMPMHSTSLGKAILAELSPEQVEQIIERHGLPKRTEATITHADDLHEELAKTRQRGYAIDDEENIPGVRCIGMAIAAPDTDVLGALSISGPSQRMTDERIENDLSGVIAQAANVIEVNSMYS